MGPFFFVPRIPNAGLQGLKYGRIMADIMSPQNKLDEILRRALYRADLVRRAKAVVRKKTEAELAAEHHINGLEKRRRLRALLADDGMDAMRFRWYFTRIKKDTPLDELRAWIDAKIAKGEEL